MMIQELWLVHPAEGMRETKDQARLLRSLRFLLFQCNCRPIWFDPQYAPPMDINPYQSPQTADRPQRSSKPLSRASLLIGVSSLGIALLLISMGVALSTSVCRSEAQVGRNPIGALASLWL